MDVEERLVNYIFVVLWIKKLQKCNFMFRQKSGFKIAIT